MPRPVREQRAQRPQPMEEEDGYEAGSQDTAYDDMHYVGSGVPSKSFKMLQEYVGEEEENRGE